MKAKLFGTLLLLYALSLLARLGAASILGVGYPMDNDEPEYYDPAIHIAAGEGYRKIPQQSPDQVAQLTAYRMPGPSLFLALVMKLFGGGVATARLTSAVVSSLGAPLVYLLTRRIAGPRAATLSGLACAVYPSYIYYSLRIFSEPYFIPLLMMAAIATAEAMKRRSHPTVLVAGVLWGLAMMVRPHALPMAGLISLYFVVRGRWLDGVLLMAGALILLVPWIARNWVVLGRPVLLATESGETLLGSNNPYVLKVPALHGMWVSPLKIPEYRERLRPIRDEFERSRVQSALALEFLSAQPTNFVLLSYYKFTRWLTPVTETRGYIRALVLASYGAMLFFLAVGLLRRVYSGSPELVITLICTFVLCVITVVYWGGLTRGRLPLEILWLPWASEAAFDSLSHLVCRLGPRRARDLQSART